MKKIIVLLILYQFASLQGMELPQEQQKKLNLAQQPLVPAPYVNSSVWNIIVQYALQEKSCKHVAKTLHAIGLTSKYFAQRFLYDPAMSGQLVQSCAKKYRGELDAICQHDLEFAAAYELNTQGIRKWMREKYFVEPKDFKVISHSFFYELNKQSARNECIKQFMLKVLPQHKPPIIQRRLNDMRTTSQKIIEYKIGGGFEDIPRYTQATKDFLEQLGATTKKVSHETRSIFSDRAETVLSQNLDVEDEFHGGFLPLTSVFDSAAESAAVKVALLLAAGANPNNRDGYNNSCPLCWAIVKKDLASQKLLLEAGANPDTHFTKKHVTWVYNTPLFRTIKYGSIEAAKQLLAFGADPNMPDHCGHYPLEYVITCANQSDMQDRIDYLLPLLEAGANPQQPLKDGTTPITLARKFGTRGIEELLMKFAKQPPKVKALIHKFNELSKK